MNFFRRLINEMSGIEDNDSLPPGAIKGYKYTYRTKDGQSYFKFVYWWNGEYFDFEIIDQPSYGSRDNDINITHRLPLLRNGYRMKICINENKKRLFNNLDSAHSLVKGWSELTWTYIKTGVTLDEQIERRTSHA